MNFEKTIIKADKMATLKMSNYGAYIINETLSKGCAEKSADESGLYAFKRIS